MTVAVHCTHCGASYSVSEKALGRTGECKKCGRKFKVASAEVSTSGAGETVDEPRSPAAGSAGRLGERIGRFTIWKHLGSGAFGDVYQAQDTLLKRDVAIKLPHAGAFASETQRARFLREPQAAAGLRHPNIVPIYDAGVEGEQFYIASAFIDGQVLAHRLDENRPDFRQAATMMIALAEALDYAHGEGIIHRDIKPANIMLDSKDEPLLMDFGLARLREAEDQLTHDGTVLGTPAYMAPEQAAGKQDDVGPASDQYSLGVMLYEMLCGRRPFEGPAAAVVSMVIHQEPDSPRTHNSAIPRDLETICTKAMAKRSHDRYASCSELADDLRRWLNGEPIRARRMGLVERSGKWARRNPSLAAMAVIVASLAVVSSATALALFRSARQLDNAFAQVGVHRESAVEVIGELQAESKRRQVLEEEVESHQNALVSAGEKLAALNQKLAAQEARAEQHEQDAERLALENKAIAEAQRKNDRANEKALQSARREAKLAAGKASRDLYKHLLSTANEQIQEGRQTTAARILMMCQTEEFSSLSGWELNYLRHRCTETPVRIKMLTKQQLPASLLNRLVPRVQFGCDSSIFVALGGRAELTEAVRETATWQPATGLPSNARTGTFSMHGHRLVVSVGQQLGLFSRTENGIWSLDGELMQSGGWQTPGCFDAQNRRFAMARYNSKEKSSKLLVWDLATRELLTQADDVSISSDADLRFNDQGDRLLLRSIHKARSPAWSEATVIDVETGKPVELVAGRKILGIDNSGRRCVIGGQEVALYDLSTNTQLCSLPPATTICEFSENGSRLICKGAKVHELWDAEAGKLLGTIPLRGNNAAFSPNGRRLVVVGESGALHVFDATRNAQLILRITDGFPAVRDVVFDPRGQYLAVVEPRQVTVFNIGPIEPGSQNQDM